MMKPCEVCDTLSDQSRCEEHRPTPAPKTAAKTKANSRDYNGAWKILSRKARKMQPWCLWCGSTKNLQCDHTPTAWERKLAGKSIRIEDVRVLCGPCNIEAGQAKPGPGQRTSEERPTQEQPLPPTGRSLTGRGVGVNVPRDSPAVRQSLSNTSALSSQYPVVAPW